MVALHLQQREWLQPQLLLIDALANNAGCMKC
jgi:hypothetical protein